MPAPIPGKLTYATSGIATTNHLAMEELAAREKIELVHVPYRAANESAVPWLGAR